MIMSWKRNEKVMRYSQEIHEKAIEKLSESLEKVRRNSGQKLCKIHDKVMRKLW